MDGGTNSVALAPGQQRLALSVLLVRLVAVVLLAAAILKSHLLATEPMLFHGPIGESRGVAIVLVQFECFLGMWLLSGWARKYAQRLACVTFVGFATVSFSKWLLGETHCGCFGRVPTPPWMALLVDIAASVVLVHSSFANVGRSDARPKEAPSETGDPQATTRLRGNEDPLRHPPFGWLAVWVIVAAGCGIAATYRTRSDVVDGVGSRMGGTVVIEPRRMIGQPFILGQYIDIGRRLAQGRWCIVLYRAGCPDCESLLLRWPEVVDRHRAEKFSTALVAVPSPQEAASVNAVADAVQGSLSNDVEWFVTTPLIVFVDDNRVVEIRSGKQEETNSHG